MKFKNVDFLPIIVAIITSIILTWPLLPNISSFYPDQGDYSLNGDMLWYNQDSIKTGRIFNQKEYWQGFQFYPQSYSLAMASNPLSGEVIFAPIFWLTNNLAFSVNMYAFLSLVLSFLSMYYLVSYFTKNSWASLIGAFIFAFNPQTMVRFPQHIDLLSKFYLPLVFLFAYRLFEKPTWKISLLFFLSFTLNAFTHSYYQIFSVIMLPILSLAFFIPKLKTKDWSYFLNLFKVSLLGLIFVPVLLYFDLPTLNFTQKEGAFRSLESVPFFSARINDWFSASPDSLIYGGFVKSMDPIREPKDDRGILNYEEHTLFTGILALILFVLGLKQFKKSKLNHSFFYILLAIPFILTLGPYFNGASEGFPLPYYWLYRLIPLMEGIRSPGRFEFLFYIPFALIGSFGVLFILEKKKEIGIWIVVGLLTILTLENMTVKNFDTKSNALMVANSIGVDKLAFLKGKTTLHLPIYSLSDADVFGKNSAYLNWATQTGEKIFNGNASYLPPDQMGFLESLRNGLNDKSISILKGLGVEYIILHGDCKKDSVCLGEGVSVIDLSKISMKIPICQQTNLGLTEIGEGELMIKNQDNCYLLFPGDKRYQENSKFKFRMPIFIEPGGQVVVTVADKTLRIE